MVFSSSNAEAELKQPILLHQEGVNIGRRDGLASLFDVLVNFGAEVSVHSLLLLCDSHSLLLSLLLNVEVVSNPSLVHVGFK